jgi:hypothetical protein
VAFDVRADRGSRGPRLAGYSPIKIQSLELTDSKELRERVSGLGRLFRLVGAFAIARV